MQSFPKRVWQGRENLLRCLTLSMSFSLLLGGNCAEAKSREPDKGPSDEFQRS